MASNANWFGAYARWAGLSDGDAIDTERRNKVVARMKEHLDAAMPRASDVLSDRAPGFLLDLCSALYAIDHGKPFQVETVRTLARAPGRLRIIVCPTTSETSSRQSRPNVIGSDTRIRKF